MDPPIFYAPPGSLQNGLIELPQAESRHAMEVLRLRPPDIVMVVDGSGMAYRGEIVRTGVKKKVQVRIHSELRNFGEPAVKLTLAAGLSVGSKFDTIVQKGTELGVSRFVPVICEKSKVRVNDAGKTANKLKRLERVALSAIKQCRRSCCPEVAMPVTLSDFLTETDLNGANLVFHPSDKTVPLDKIGLDRRTKRVTSLIGPESGFTREEVALAVAAGYQVVSLGARILRTETAGPTVCALVMSYLGELD